MASLLELPPPTIPGARCDGFGNIDIWWNPEWEITACTGCPACTAEVTA